MRQKITVAVPFKIWPPISGGQLRVYHLYRNLSKWFDIELVTMDHPSGELQIKNLSNGYTEIRVPKSEIHQKNEDGMSKKVGIACSDIAVVENTFLSQTYLKELRKSVEGSVAVIVCHPYLYYAVKSITNKPIWYEAQDVEYILKNRIIPESPYKDDIIHMIHKVEEECCRNSDIVFTCSEADAVLLQNLYGVEEEKFMIVPNGVHIKRDNESSIESYSKGNRLIFVGSGHPPNIIAVENLIELAKTMSDFTFHIVGACGASRASSDIPDNVEIHGVVNNSEKDKLLKSSNIALNPMPYGSGTNLKMIEYFANGLPVVTTLIGARGIPIQNDTHAIICTMEQFKASILRLHQNIEYYEKIKNNALQLAKSEYSWEIIAENFYNELVVKGKVRNEDGRLSFDLDLVEVSEEEVLKNKVVDRPLYLFGAGNGGVEAARLLKRNNIKINGFIDNGQKKWGIFINGYSVYKPQFILENWKGETNKPFIVVTSIYSSEISKQLDTLGFIRNEDYFIQELDIPYISFK